MLATFRENARSWIIQLAIAAMALVFIFSFGPGSNGCGDPSGPTWAARVNGQEVPASLFNDAFERRVDFQRRIRRGSLSVDDLRQANVREETMKDVVEMELVAQAARDHGLWISDDEVADEILGNENFQKEGQFDEKLYDRYTKYYGLSKARFEERIRRELLAQRMYRLALDTLSVSDDELRAEFQKNEEGASIEYVRFTPGQYAEGIQITPADAEAFLKANEADVKKKYEDTKFTYVKPRAIKAARLFQPVKADASKEAEEAARKKVEEAAAALKSGTKFEELAVQFTDDVAVGQGGLLSADEGWVSLGRSPYGKTFEETLFKLKPGELSPVSRDRFGFFIVKALEERQASESSFDDVKLKIATDLAKQGKAKELALAAATTTLEKLKAGTPLATQWPKEEAKADDHARQPGEVHADVPHSAVTETFHPIGGIVPGIGSAPKLSATVFSLSAEKRLPDAPIEDNNAIFVFELETRQRPDMAKFDAEKEALRDRLKGQKQSEFKDKWVEQLRNAAKVSENAQLLSYETTGAGVRGS